MRLFLVKNQVALVIKLLVIAPLPRDECCRVAHAMVCPRCWNVANVCVVLLLRQSHRFGRRTQGMDGMGWKLSVTWNPWLLNVRH